MDGDLLYRDAVLSRSFSLSIEDAVRYRSIYIARRIEVYS